MTENCGEKKALRWVGSGLGGGGISFYINNLQADNALIFKLGFAITYGKIG